MLLSEAIRLGAMLRPQTPKGQTRNAEGTCAMGAALDAIGKQGHYCDLPIYWPWTGIVPGVLVVNPVTSQDESMVMSVIRKLNDNHRWTRERIADWVEQEERKRGLIPEPAVEQPIAVEVTA